MSGFKHFKGLTAVLVAWLLFPACGGAQTISRLSSRFLARGEKALLEVSISGVQPTDFPNLPALKGVEIRPAGRGAQTKLMPGRRLEYVFEYIVSSYETGSHILPPIEVEAGGLKTRTEPLEFRVFNPDDLQWAEAEAGGLRFRYASAFRVMNPRPYEGETTPVEIKIFVPDNLLVEDWGLPDFARDGVTVWRLQPSAMRGDINLLGQRYKSVAYPSTLTPTRRGMVGIGPATIRLMTIQTILDGYTRRVSQEVNVSVPKLEIESMELPKGAPAGFENAVGDFKISTSTSVTEVQEGDPIPVEIVVSGSGNLDTLRPPKPIDAEGWKTYESTTEQRGDERRELSGRTVFHQFMRPLEIKPAVPAFRLVYFDPKDETYKTLTTEPIPLQMKPSTAPKSAAIAPPKAAQVPVERMTDILGNLQPANLTMAVKSRIPGWAGHALGVMIALGLIAKAIWMRIASRFRKDPAYDSRMKELREIERMKTDDTGFLMSAGRFIERWLGENPPPDVQAVLAERDAVCFRPEKTRSSVLEPNRRTAILKVLRKSAMAWLILTALVLGSGQARAEDIAKQAQTAYESAKYDEAIGLWLKAGPYEALAPDTLYNIGNACYRAGSPGQAALYYRRALVRNPGHVESRQNLRFIERKYGSLTVQRPEYQDALTRFPLSTWKGMLWTGAWLCGLALLVIPATRHGSPLRVIAAAAWVIGPMLAASGGLGWRYFPNDSEFAPLARQAVIIDENVILHADAARTSPEVIDAPPGSLCEVIHESGRWAYVSFATKTRGWLPVSALEKIVPAGQPAPPTIRKPKADGKSA